MWHFTSPPLSLAPSLTSIERLASPKVPSAAPPFTPVHCLTVGMSTLKIHSQGLFGPLILLLNDGKISCARSRQKGAASGPSSTPPASRAKRRQDSLSYPRQDDWNVQEQAPGVSK